MDLLSAWMFKRKRSAIASRMRAGRHRYRNAFATGVTYNLAASIRCIRSAARGRCSWHRNFSLKLALYSAFGRDDVDAYRWISLRKSAYRFRGRDGVHEGRSISFASSASNSNGGPRSTENGPDRSGLERLKDERRFLLTRERPAVKANPPIDLPEAPRERGRRRRGHSSERPCAMPKPRKRSGW